MRALPHRHTGLRVVDLTRHFRDQARQGRGSLDIEPAAPVSVGVEVGDRTAAELVGVGFPPFGAAEQHLLFAVPQREHDRAPRPPSLLEERTVRARLLEQRDRARHGILGAVDPGVVVIAPHDPFVGPGGAGDPGDHVVRRDDPPVEAELEMDSRRAGSDVIGDRQSPGPPGRRGPAADRGEQRLRIGPGERLNWNRRERRRLGSVEPLRVLRRADPGGQRVADEERHVHHAPALHALPRAEWTGRVGVPRVIAVVLRVRVDEAAHGAVLRGQLRLDAAPGPAVLGDHDRALDRHAEALESVVVLRNAVVDEDERRGDVAVGRVRVVGRELLRLLSAGGVLLEGRLPQRGGEPLRRHQLDDPFPRGGEQHVEGLDPGVEPPGLEAVQDPRGVRAVAGGAEVVGPGRQDAHVLPQ